MRANLRTEVLVVGVPDERRWEEIKRLAVQLAEESREVADQSRKEVEDLIRRSEKARQRLLRAER